MLSRERGLLELWNEPNQDIRFLTGTRSSTLTLFHWHKATADGSVAYQDWAENERKNSLKSPCKNHQYHRKSL